MTIMRDCWNESRYSKPYGGNPPEDRPREPKQEQHAPALLPFPRSAPNKAA